MNRDFLYVFLAGSVMYVALHWYLHLDDRAGIVEHVKRYLYYAMAIDLGVAYVLTRYFAPAPQEEDEDKDKEKDKRQYTDEEKKIMMARMQEARRQQMQVQMQRDHERTIHEQERLRKERQDRREKQELQEKQAREQVAEDNAPKGAESRGEVRMDGRTDGPARMREADSESTRSAGHMDSDGGKPSIFSKSTASDSTTEESVPEKRAAEKRVAEKRVVKNRTSESRASPKKTSPRVNESVEDLDTPIKISTNKENLRVKRKESSRDSQVSGTSHHSRASQASQLDDTEIPMFK